MADMEAGRAEHIINENDPIPPTILTVFKIQLRAGADVYGKFTIINDLYNFGLWDEAEWLRANLSRWMEIIREAREVIEIEGPHE